MFLRMTDANGNVLCDVDTAGKTFTITGAFVLGGSAPSPIVKMASKRSKDQAAPWWKRITG